MTDFEALLSLLAEPDQPRAIFAALDRVTKSLVGHRLFTLNYLDGRQIARAYSSRPAEYEVAGRKPIGNTPWDHLVLRDRQPFLGPDLAAIRWAFFDHALIESMGLGAVINIPVIYDGKTIGTMNLLDAEHRYGTSDMLKILPLAPLLIPAFLQARQ